MSLYALLVNFCSKLVYSAYNTLIADGRMYPFTLRSSCRHGTFLLTNNGKFLISGVQDQLMVEK